LSGQVSTTVQAKAEEPRIGVYVCYCGLNIAGTVDVEEVAEYARKLPNVVYVVTPVPIQAKRKFEKASENTS